MIGLFVLTFILGFISIWLLNKLINNPKNLPPGPFRLPLVGNLVQVAQADPKYFYVAIQKLGNIYGGCMYLQLGSTKSVAITGYDAVKKAFDEEGFLFRSDSKFILDRTFGQSIGLSFSRHEQWRQSRRFTVKNLKEFGFGKNYSMDSAFIEECDAFTKQLMTKTKEDGLVSNEHLFTAFFMNSIWTMVAGYRFEYDDPRFEKLCGYSRLWVETMSIGAGILTAFPSMGDWFPKFTGFEKLHAADSEWQNYFKDIIDDIRAHRNYKNSPESFIDVYLNEIDKHKNDPSDTIFTDEFLISILLDLFVGGADTSSMLTSFTILYMIKHPEIQKQVQHEIDEVIGADRWPTIADRIKMKYTEAVIMECTRITNVIPIGPRMTITDTKFDKYTIPKDSQIFISIHSVHMDEDYWGDPHIFRPSRFIGPDGNHTNTEHLMAFGAGKKNCIGEATGRFNIFMLFVRLMQQYTFSEDPAHIGEVQTHPVPGITQCPYPCKIRMQPRNF